MTNEKLSHNDTASLHLCGRCRCVYEALIHLLSSDLIGKTVETIRKKNRKVEKTSKSECVSKEYHSTKFYRAFNLPENVVADEIHAKVENGITNIFLPKVTPTKNKKVNRKIDIV